MNLPSGDLQVLARVRSLSRTIVITMSSIASILELIDIFSKKISLGHECKEGAV